MMTKDTLFIHLTKEQFQNKMAKNVNGYVFPSRFWYNAAHDLNLINATPMPKHYLLYGVCVLALAITSAQAQDIDPQAVNQAIHRGIEFLKRQQNADGSWKVEGMPAERTGTTAKALACCIVFLDVTSRDRS